MNASNEIISNASMASNTIVEQSNTVGEIWLVVAIISTLLLFLAVFWVFLTPIGKESLGRWLNKKKYYKGGYTNAIIFTKDGLAKEVFSRNEDGKFNFNDKPYIRVPQLALPYKGMPTLFYIEGTASPIDIFERDRNDLLSCNELDITMNHQLNFDFKEWFSKNKGYIMIAFAVIILGLAVSLYFSYTMWEWVRDGAPAIKQGVSQLSNSKVV